LLDASVLKTIQILHIEINYSSVELDLFY